MADNSALIAAALLLAVVFLCSAISVCRLHLPNRRERARLQAERIERLFRDETPEEGA
tara:strand:+ start:501 stop:674 length:174 start_codon:yes stop_codon:yes gene_type:complete